MKSPMPFGGGCRVAPGMDDTGVDPALWVTGQPAPCGSPPVEDIVKAAVWHTEPSPMPFGGESWPIKALHLVTKSDLSPGFDFVALLESPDGVINKLRVRLGAAEKPDAEGVVDHGGLLHLVAVEWNEQQVIENVALSFLRPHVIMRFLGEFSSHIADLINAGANPPAMSSTNEGRAA